MNSIIEKISCRLNAVTIFIAVICLLVMVFTLFIGVFFRYVMNNALTWSDEIALLSFSWSIFLYSSVLVREKAHANLTIFLNALTTKHSLIIQKINHFIILFFGICLFIFGWQFIEFTTGQVSPTLRYPLWLQIIPIPISGALIAIHSLNLIIQPASTNEVTP